jgi:lipopolysaccharide transport system ATP-binding protein
MRRVREICESGATVLFVSHSTGLVAELCNRAIWIDQGRILADGDAKRVTTAYTHSVWERVEAANQSQNERLHQQVLETAATGQYTLGGDELRIARVDLHGGDGAPRTVFTNGDPLHLRVRWEGQTSHPGVYGTFRVDSDRVQGILGCEAWELPAFLNGKQPLDGSGEFEFVIPELHLGQGDYFVSCGLCREMMPKGKEAILHYVERVLRFSVRRKQQFPFSYVYEPTIEVRERPVRGAA